MAGRILVRPDGQKVEVPEENFRAALANGYREEAPEEYETRKAGEQPGLAFAEGVGRGATVGLSDLAASALGEDMSKIKARKEANPKASLAGDLTGIAAGSFAGPVSAIGKAGGAVRALAGGGLGGALAAGAVEGTLFGTGTMISEASLGDTALNAEKLAGISGGALFGAGLSGLTHGAGKLASSALTKVFGGNVLQNALEDVAAAHAGSGKMFGLPSVAEAWGVAKEAGIAGAIGGAFGGPKGVALGAALGAGRKLAKEYVPDMIAGAANKLAESGAVKRIADTLKGSIESLSGQGMLGAYRPILMDAAAQGSMALLAAHVNLAQTDPKYLPTLGMLHEEGDAANQYAQKAGTLESLASKLKEHDNEVEGGIARILGKVGGVAPKAQRTEASMPDFEARMKRLTSVLENPEMIDTSSLASVAPALAMQTAIQAQNAAGFLLNKAPKNPSMGLPAFTRPWVVPQAELAKFYRYVDAAERPAGVLKNLARDGSVTKEEIETLNVLYPQILQDMKDKLMNRLLEFKEPLSYNRKRGLGSLFGAGFIDQNPQQLQLLQSIHAGSVAGQQPQGAGPKKDGRQNQSQEDNVSTQAQRTEAR